MEMELLKKIWKIFILGFALFILYVALRPQSKLYEKTVQRKLERNFNGKVIKKGIEPMTHNTLYIYLNNRKKFPISEYFYDSIKINDSIVKKKGTKYIHVFRKDTTFTIDIVSMYKVLTGDKDDYVNDVEEIFTKKEIQKLNKKIANSKLPFYLVTVTGKYDYRNYEDLSDMIFYSRRFKDNTILFIISKSKRIFQTTNLKMAISEDIIYPIVEKTIMVNFKKKEFYKGIDTFIDETNKLIEKNPHVLNKSGFKFYIKIPL